MRRGGSVPDFVATMKNDFSSISTGIVTGRSMRWISHKFFGVDPNAPVESLDDPLPVHGIGGHVGHGGHAASVPVPQDSPPGASDEFPIDTEIVIPTIVKHP